MCLTRGPLTSKTRVEGSWSSDAGGEEVRGCESVGKEVTTDQLSCVLATISYPLHSLKSSVTLATRDIMLGQGHH